MNMYFTRDQVITTAKGIVVGKMKDAQREKETEIIRLVLDNLGITPVYEITGNAVLEGGDFIPAGERVFIGQGLRTNAEAIEQMLANDVFGGGVREVVVVKETWRNQQEMHLDTYFNVAAEKTAVLVEDRFPGNCESAGGGTVGDNKCLNVDVWERTSSCGGGTVVGNYCLTAENTDKEFVQLLGEVNFENIIPVSVADQIAYGINFLTVKENKIIGVEGVSPDYKTALGNVGVTAEWIDFDNMKLGYGAAHCTTQVLSRTP